MPGRTCQDVSVVIFIFSNLRDSPSREKHKRIVLTILGFEGPNTQDKVERVTAASGHLFEDAPLAFYLLLYGASNPLPRMSFLVKLLNNTPAEDSNYDNIRMLGRANTAWFDFGIRFGMGTCGHDTSHQFGE